MKTFVCTLTLPDGNKIVAKARADSLDEEVDIQWTGASQRLGQIALGKHTVGFLRWYLEARAQNLRGEFDFRNGDGSENKKLTKPAKPRRQGGKTRTR